MSVQKSLTVFGAVEGMVDEAVLRRLLAEVGVRTALVYGRNGKQDLLRRVEGYNRGARFDPWVVLVDLDDDAECAPPFRRKWVPDMAPFMCFRVAVHELEAWLLADREALSGFLRVSLSHLPLNPGIRDIGEAYSCHFTPLPR